MFPFLLSFVVFLTLMLLLVRVFLPRMVVRKNKVPKYRKIFEIAVKNVFVPFFASAGLILILYGIALGLKDNSRFWHIVEGLVLILCAGLAELLWRRVSKRRKDSQKGVN